MANIAIPFVAVPLAQVPSVGFNNNFTEIASKFNTYAVQTDVAKTITVTHQWNASQTFNAGLAMAGDLLFTDALYDIGKSGATRPRDIFTSRDVTIGGALKTTIVNSDLVFTDNTYDIGHSASQRPRHGYFSGNITIGGVVVAASEVDVGSVIVAQAGAPNALVTGSLTGDFVVRTPTKNVLFTVDGGSTIALKIATGGLITFPQAGMGGDLLFTDALYDIGKSGATRPRDLFMSRNLTVGGTSLLTGQVSFSALQTKFINNAALLFRNFANSADVTALALGVGDNIVIGTGATSLELRPGTIGFFGLTGGTRPTVTGSRGANAALASLLTGLASLNLVLDSST